MLPSALVLGVFAVVGTGLVAFTQSLTADRILENERATLLRTLHTLVPPERYDNELFKDTVEVHDPERLGTREPVTVFIARREGQPVAAVFNTIAPDGYSGSIRLLVAVNRDGTLAGVRVIAHRETPGLGDYIEAGRSDWIHAFAGKSLQDPPPARWRVRRDGGEFEQFTGATITPRAVVRAVYNTLRYYEARGEHLFGQPEETQDE
ncbi:electron transport complex subunit RsxG [Ectothiorhodospiraceae bacterium 2226]|nr:electron transport complex subunit RsxG [Ectothiorhodospiraceae bacterium 2226]